MNGNDSGHEDPRPLVIGSVAFGPSPDGSTGTVPVPLPAAIVRAPEIVALKCTGGTLAYLINRRFLRYRCLERVCRRPDDPDGKRFKVYHTKDLALGGLTVRHEYEDRITGEVITVEVGPSWDGVKSAEDSMTSASTS